MHPIPLNNWNINVRCELNLATNVQNVSNLVFLNLNQSSVYLTESRRPDYATIGWFASLVVMTVVDSIR